MVSPKFDERKRGNCSSFLWEALACREETTERLFQALVAGMSHNFSVMTKQRHRQCKPLHTVWARHLEFAVSCQYGEPVHHIGAMR
jgi:hypothetical protein